MKSLFITFFATLISILAISQDNGCIYGDCENGFGKKEIEGLTYIGEFEEGNFHGVGTISSSEGGSYTGMWKDGKMEAFGELIRADGSTVTGQFHLGNIHGVAIERDTKGKLMYQGEFKDGLYSGQGYYYLQDEGKRVLANSENGDPIESISSEPIDEGITGLIECISGDCENGIGHERSMIIYSYGEFTNGNINGNAVEIISGISFYVGDLQDGVKNGVGHSVTFGTFYVGEYKDGKRNGTGLVYDSDGSYYKGTFVDNEKHGYGMYYDASGKILFEGNFANDQIHGTGDVYDYDNNEIITSTWENGEVISAISRRPMEETSSISKIAPILKKKELTYKTCAGEETESLCLFPILNQKVADFKSDGYSGTELHKKLADEIRIISSEYDSRIATESFILSDIAQDDDLLSGMMEQFSSEEQEILLGHLSDIMQELEDVE